MSESHKMISAGVQTAYDHFYQNHNEQWRLLGAKYKAQNILDVCRGHHFKKVLEVGAGDGSILKFLDEWNFSEELHALEIAESGVELIRKKNLKHLKSVQSFDGYKTPFADNEFDLVILAHVLEHVEHERILIRELKRISKYQVIEVPRDYKYGIDKRMKHFLDYGHINMYTPSGLRFMLQSEGLTIVKDKTSVIPPEVTKFNLFVNQAKPKSVFKSLKIDLEFRVKNFLGKIAGKRVSDHFANAYTVLTKGSTDLNIF
ncbi:class I SAM-dependent methyltransferase [Daejeonella oryzae]|uniref:class I SAM-dependent methyltransferase n=1 Tax=Daejeonella oryzae TaxID=1122943 RepID=UPI00040942B3|nr:class I SAM-dependent methyltransferase [Daejeonella oryzae]